MVAVKPAVADPAETGFLERIADGVCRRAFSSPEAAAYELTIAPALASWLEPEIRQVLTQGRVLDVGCGGGRIAEGLARAGFSVVGLDPSHSQAHRFQRNADHAAGVVQATAEELPFSDASFDGLYSSCAWKHWPNPHLGIAECIRVTKSGGTVAAIEIDGSATAEEFWIFARTSRIPLGLHKAYLRFAMRTVVGVAPGRDQLAASFDGQSVSGLNIRRIAKSPFLLVTGSVA